jgi:hypothetical protein
MACGQPRSCNSRLIITAGQATDAHTMHRKADAIMSLPPAAGPCQPDPPLPDRPHPKVILVIVVLTFTGLLLVLGYDIRAALFCAAGAGAIAAEVVRRVLNARLA